MAVPVFSTAVQHAELIERELARHYAVWDHSVSWDIEDRDRLILRRIFYYFGFGREYQEVLKELAPLEFRNREVEEYLGPIPTRHIEIVRNMIKAVQRTWERSQTPDMEYALYDLLQGRICSPHFLHCQCF